MRYNKSAFLGLVISLIVCAGAATARGATIGPVTLVLTPGAGYDNQLDLTVSLGGGSYTDTQSAAAVGNLLANLDLSFDPVTHAATVNGIGFIRNHPYDPAAQGSMSFSTMTFDFTSTLGGTIVAANLKGTIGTEAPTGTVSGGSFSAADHQLYINSGSFAGLGMNFDLSADYVAADGSGTGTISVGAPVVDGNLATYSLELLMPFRFTEAIEGDPNTTASADGIIRATGSFTQVIPEPGSLVMMLGFATGLIVYGWLRRRG